MKVKTSKLCDVNQLKQGGFGNQQKWSLPNQRFATFTFRWRFLHWTDFCYELHSLKVSPWKWAETQLERIDFQPGSFRCELWEPQRGEKDCFSAAIFSEKIWFCNLTILFFVDWRSDQVKFQEVFGASLLNVGQQKGDNLGKIGRKIDESTNRA